MVADTDINCRDFLVQNTITLSAPAAAGSNNIKVASVADFSIGQKIIIDSGTNSETAVIATIGTPGGTTVGTATRAGADSYPVASVEGFSAGQTITIDNGANLETAVVASVTAGRRRFGAPGTIPGRHQSQLPCLLNMHMQQVHRSPAAVLLLPLL